jgi:parallel beta-helix repeat protein
MVLNESSPLIQGNIIKDNVASNLGGGILFAEFSGGILERNIINGNTALDDWGGGIALWNNSNPAIINNLIINNSCSGFNGGRGGGIYLDHSDSKLVNNTIAFNYTTGDDYGDGLGGGICIGKWANPVIRNCIIWYNLSGVASMNIYFEPREWLDISYSNVEEDLGHIYELKPYTNMDDPPEFVDPENGDFHLSLKSPCINRGIPDTTGLFLPSLDLSGALRIFLDTVDMGAYEINSPTGNPWLSEESDILLYPNPSAGISFLEMKAVSAQDDLIIKIYNARGDLIAEEHPDGTEAVLPIDLSTAKEGIYFLSLMSKGRVLYRQKLIKK